MGYLGLMPILILGSKKIAIPDISTFITCILYQLNVVIMQLVTKMCNGASVSYILTNFLPNIRALNRKPFTY